MPSYQYCLWKSILTKIKDNTSNFTISLFSYRWLTQCTKIKSITGRMGRSAERLSILRLSSPCCSILCFSASCNITPKFKSRFTLTSYKYSLVELETTTTIKNASTEHNENLCSFCQWLINLSLPCDNRQSPYTMCGGGINYSNATQLHISTVFSYLELCVTHSCTMMTSLFICRQENIGNYTTNAATTKKNIRCFLWLHIRHSYKNRRRQKRRPYEGCSISSEKSNEGIFISWNHVAIRNFTSLEACLEK